MPSIRSNAADKNIVDRSKPRRNGEVAKTIRMTRERLVHQPGNIVFDRELLKLHARAMVSGATAIPLLILVIAAGGLFVGLTMSIALWALISVASYSGLTVVAMKTDRTPTDKLPVLFTARSFLVTHVISGLGWTYLAALQCNDCNLEQYAVIKAVLLLVAIAATALVAASLRGALIATFALPVLVYAIKGADLSRPVEIVMATTLVLSLPFFSYIAGQMNKSSLMLLSFRTEKDSLIAELETAKAMSEEARHRAEEANLAKSRFLASMSHELRTPLNAILGFSEVMESEVLGPMANPTYREYAHDIHASGQHLLDLINEILDLSRIEAGRYQLNEEPLTLIHIVEECCHLMTLRARSKGITIVEDFEKDLPRLFGDERAIRQIALNLLSNAVKFSPTGGEIRVRVGWTAGGGQYIAIKDNGPGIPEDEIPIVLSAFGQGTIAIKSAEQGTGLGLPIVQALISMHGGEFQLHSKLREGTDVVAIFPPFRVMEVLPALPADRAPALRRA